MKHIPELHQTEVLRHLPSTTECEWGPVGFSNSVHASSVTKALIVYLAPVMWLYSFEIPNTAIRQSICI